LYRSTDGKKIFTPAGKVGNVVPINGIDKTRTVETSGVLSPEMIRDPEVGACLDGYEQAHIVMQPGLLPGLCLQGKGDENEQKYG
jgi:hypothetical protein